MRFKNALSLFLPVYLVVSLSVFVSANELAVKPVDISYPISSTKIKDSSSISKNFMVISDYKYVKIFYDNLGDIQVTMYIKKPDGTLIEPPFRIDGHSNNSYIIESAPSGQYTIDISSQGGAENLNGTLVVKGSNLPISAVSESGQLIVKPVNATYLIPSKKINGSSSFSRNFMLPSDYKFVKISYDNIGSVGATMYIKKPDGIIIEPALQIDAGCAGYYIVESAQSGQYTIGISSQDGAENLNGTLVVVGSSLPMTESEK